MIRSAAACSWTYCFFFVIGCLIGQHPQAESEQVQELLSEEKQTAYAEANVLWNHGDLLKELLLSLVVAAGKRCGQRFSALFPEVSNEKFKSYLEGFPMCSKSLLQAQHNLPVFLTVLVKVVPKFCLFKTPPE